MSHIFDALLRSESERSGARTTVIGTASELLERAERQALSQWESETKAGESQEPGLSQALLEILPEAIRADQPVGQFPFSPEGPRNSRDEVFSSFPAVAASPSAESHLVSVTDRDSPAAEAFRLLEVRLRNLRKLKPLKKVLITSTTPEEGKSFAAANLACTLASGTEEKVLLIGGDLRRPTLAKLFGAAVNAGICEYLRDERSLSSCIYRLEKPGIWLLPAGRSQDDPLEMIQSTKFPPLIEQLAEWFDWIIIDSPPMLPLADTTALARLADGILLVVRRGVTQKRKLQKGLEAFESDKLIGALLNSSNSASDKEYYYYRPAPASEDRVKVTLKAASRNSPAR